MGLLGHVCSSKAVTVRQTGYPVVFQVKISAGSDSESSANILISAT